MFVVSVNHKTSSTDFREKLAFDETKNKEFLNRLKQAGIEEAVYLNTCNRCEVYGVGKASTLIPVWADLAGVEIEELKEHLLFFDGQGAINHLFYVSAGFESMVLGEDEILRQIKDAYFYSLEEGYTSYELNTIFQAAIACSKRIKTETKLSKTSVSIASLAATKIHNYKSGIKNVMIMGASGDTGNKVLRNLLSYGDCQIFVTKHMHQISNPNITVVPFHDRYEYIADMDVIVSATKSPHYTMIYGKLKEQGIDERDRLFVDLAVPRDIDEDIIKLSGSELITIDDFQNIAKENNAMKQQEKESGEEIIEEEINALVKELTFHDNRKLFESLKENPIDRVEQFIYKYKDIASSDEFISFVNVLNRMQYK